MSIDRPAGHSAGGGHRFGRRALLRGGCVAAGCAAAAAAVDGTLVTPWRIATSTLSFGGDTAGTSGDERSPLRILQVSDLHLHDDRAFLRLLLERIHESPADLIALTGDAIDDRDDMPVLELFLRELPAASRIVAIYGNWEHRCGIAIPELSRVYERHGVELLVNRSVDVEHRGRLLRVTGLDDWLLGRPDAVAALENATPRDRHLVLVHCPAARDALGLPSEHPASLVLSGHTHGGQIAPLGIAPFRPRGSGRYVAGWYRDDGPPMYVSRGIGTSLMPVRIGATPELVRLEWRLGPGSGHVEPPQSRRRGGAFPIT